MARKVPEGRLEQLVDCATRVFIEQGYARTQMADVAAALGVAKGTLYLYVESKEALFDLVARYADAGRPFAKRPPLPVRTPKPGATVKYVRDRLAQSGVPPGLAKALSQQRVADVRVELEGIVRELYENVAHLKDQGIAILIVEQFAEMALQVADVAAIMGQGRIQAVGEPAEIGRLLSQSYLGGAA